MNFLSLLKEPSTYAGMAGLLLAIPALIASGFTDATAWGAVMTSLVAILRREAVKA